MQSPCKQIEFFVMNVLLSILKFTKNFHSPSGIRGKDSGLKTLIQQAPRFSGYETSYSLKGKKVALTGVSIRPANLFFEALFQSGSIQTTLPGSGQLFAFNEPPEAVREFLRKQALSRPNEPVSFSAKSKSGYVALDHSFRQKIADLSDIFGSNTYQMTYQEIWETLNSQEIFLSPLLPLPFYQKLKTAMRLDNIVTLPGNDHDPVVLQSLEESECYPHLRDLCLCMKQSPDQLGLSKEQVEWLSHLTLYQIGTLIVKREDYHVFVDEHQKILARLSRQNDAIRLISACGIRALAFTDPRWNREIVKTMFKTCLAAAETGLAIFPAVGMGVWGGDPDLYWRSFFDAIIESDVCLDAIFVNPGHQKSPSGRYAGCRGEEFESILKEYLKRFAADDKTSIKLKKICNLFSFQTDIIQFARRLKKQYPEKRVSLVNASDPDVTLGFHVGEYVNNCPHISTTEENYTAMGTNGLCFETISGVHDLYRIRQVDPVA
jgi:hypothetical protein